MSRYRKYQALDVFLVGVSLGLKNWKSLVEEIRLFSEFLYEIKLIYYAYGIRPEESTTRTN
jgi:hypothetical protein